ncbi:MAG: hypothetical protein LC734_03695 [Acidobacteria bacterium]|nr:hypothetical protein [Acidobacteriota bacterium]
MKLFEGRSPTEKKKIVAALVLGTVSLISLIYAFGPNFSSSGKTITVKTSPLLEGPSPAAIFLPFTSRRFRVAKIALRLSFL